MVLTFLLFLGYGCTVIGLKKRSKEKPVPFIKLPLMTKQKKISWFTSEEMARNSVENGTLIDEDAIEVIPAHISNSCLDNSVNIEIVKQFFTDDGWKLVQQIVKVKKETVVWKCSSCNLDCGNSSTILCNGCLNWIHYTCAGLLRSPKTKFWFCRKCFE